MSFFSVRFFRYLFFAVISAWFCFYTSAYAATEHCSFHTDQTNYAVQVGDTLSKILDTHVKGKIWGPRGSLQQTLALNPDLKSADTIWPGDHIQLPPLCVQTERKLTTEDLIPAKHDIAEQPVPKTEESAPTSLIPAQAPATVETANYDGDIQLALGAGYSRLDSSYASSSSTATLLSQPMESVDFRWEQHWSSEWHSFIDWKYMTLPFTNANQGNLLNASQSSTSFSLGGNYRWGDGWKVEGQLGQQGFAFAPSYSTGTATLEVKNLTFTTVELHKQFVQVRTLAVDGYLGATYVLGNSAGSYNITSGTGYDLGFRLQQDLGRYVLFAKGTYQEIDFSTSVANQTMHMIFAELGLQWSF